MADKLVVIILNSSLESSAELVEPIYHATVAASMDYRVEVILAGRAGELAMRGAANKIPSQRKPDETIYDLIKEAYQNGVVFKVSKFVTQVWNEKDLIAEGSETVSSGYIIGEIMSPNVRTLTY